MPAVLTGDPATLAVDAPDGTPVTATTVDGATLTGEVTANQVSFPGQVATILTRVMVGAGAYFDGDTPDTAADDYGWTGAPDASTSTLTNDLAIPGAITWDTLWDDAACLGPPSNFGRWSDQPASLRWDQLDPATTWNDYA